MSGSVPLIIGKDWLPEFVRQAIREDCCFRVGCTTCGAKKIGSLLMMAMVREYKHLHIAGVEFGVRHAESLSEALIGLDERRLPVSPRTEELLQFLTEVTWIHGDESTRANMKSLLRSALLRRILFRVVPEIAVEARLQVMRIPPVEWQTLRKALVGHDLLTPANNRLMGVAAEMPCRIPLDIQCLALLEILNYARERHLLDRYAIPQRAHWHGEDRDR
jgi:hypothetical protein